VHEIRSVEAKKLFIERLLVFDLTQLEDLHSKEQKRVSGLDGDVLAQTAVTDQPHPVVADLFIGDLGASQIRFDVIA
jgi:hypothetical protein